MVTAVVSLTGLGLVAAFGLSLASKKFHVDVDPRLETIEGILPGLNCGACGYPSCAMFAEALVDGKAQPGSCTVSTDEGKQTIAQFLGVDVGNVEKRVARLACAGGDNVAPYRANYVGIKSCAAVSQIAGGGKECLWGCLGLGDCEVSCDFNAIHMSTNALPIVDEELCTACGDCVDACPKDLFSLQSVNNHLWVTCKNEEFGDQVLNKCQVACTACERCAVDAPNVITMQNNLPIVDYSKTVSTKDAIERCPTGAIVWIETDGTVVYGEMTKPVYRKEKLHARAT